MESSKSILKNIVDIKVCIVELRRYFLKNSIPIDDDNFNLHRFQEELEVILQFGIKNKIGSSDIQVTYWDYLSKCLYSSKQTHPGLKYVEDTLEINTSCGKGRAFIRFCLVNKSLAHTLQSCFTNKDISNDFYDKQALPLSINVWTDLILSLHSLDEIDFELNSPHTELDSSWPFKRKRQDTLKISTNEFHHLNPNFVSKNKAFSETHLVEANSMLEEHVLYLQEKCQKLEQEICFTAQENHVDQDNRNLSTDIKERMNSSDCIPANSDGVNLIGNCEAYSSQYIGCKINAYKSIHSSIPKLSCNSTNSSLTGMEISNSDETVSTCLVPSVNDFSTAAPLKHCKFISDMKVAFFEMGTLFENFGQSINCDADKVTLLSCLKELKNMQDYLESFLETEFKRCKEFCAETNLVNNYMHNLNLISAKQADMLDSLIKKVDISINESESLYDKMHLLKDKLHSYGLLKTQTSSISFEKPVQMNMISSNVIENDNIFYSEFHRQLSNDFLAPLHTFESSFSKLNSLNCKGSSLILCIESCNKLNSNLTSRVQDQELHMKGITRELEEAHHLLSVMRKQHQKLQSAENIIKYDLQEKRKLLTRLKHQLETTREDCNVVRLKNSKSEAEWQDLRREILMRQKKQTSEESGFVDDKLAEDQTTLTESDGQSEILQQSETHMECLNDKSSDNEIIIKKSRLEMLEEQCQILCKNIILSNKKREEINGRLDLWCDAIEKNQKEKNNSNQSLYAEENVRNLKDVSDVALCKSSFCSDGDAISSLSTSEIGSLNSDGYLSASPQNSTEIISPENLQYSNSQENFYDLYGNTTSNSCDESARRVENFIICEDVTSKDAPYSNFAESYFVSSDLLPEDANLHYIEQSDHKKSQNLYYFDKKGTQSNVVLTHQRNFQTDEEKNLLLSKLKDFEILNQLLTDKLNENTLSAASKDRELEALRLQLHSQVLKYETALKEFNESTDGLRNMEEKINDQEQLILTLEEALNEIQIEKEIEKERRWEQLEDFKTYSLKDKEAMVTEIMSLQSYSKELKKKVIRLLKQKDLLWKQNDHLTFIQKTQIADRWVNDGEVSECLECKSHFSFILRKHHCRHCGRIFCYSCSNNWLFTPSSRKQIRVCNECYLQYLDIQDIVRRDSNIDCSDEGSEEEATCNTSYMNMNASNTNSFQLSNIGSLPNLPINSFQRKSCFASAPDLLVACENDHQERRYTNVSRVILQPCHTEKNGNIFIKPMGETIFHVNCELNTTEFHWSLIPNHEGIPISLTYKELPQCGNVQQTLLHQSTCEVEGVMILSLPGAYSFHFDNTMRLSSVQVYYTITVKNPSERNSHVI